VIFVKGSFSIFRNIPSFRRERICSWQISAIPPPRHFPDLSQSHIVLRLKPFFFLNMLCLCFLPPPLFKHARLVGQNRRDLRAFLSSSFPARFPSFSPHVPLFPIGVPSLLAYPIIRSLPFCLFFSPLLYLLVPSLPPRLPYGLIRVVTTSPWTPPPEVPPVRLLPGTRNHGVEKLTRVTLCRHQSFCRFLYFPLLLLPSSFSRAFTSALAPSSWTRPFLLLLLPHFPPKPNPAFRFHPVLPERSPSRIPLPLFLPIPLSTQRTNSE